MGGIKPAFGRMCGRSVRLLTALLLLLAPPYAAAAADSLDAGGRSGGAAAQATAKLTGSDPAGWAELASLEPAGPAVAQAAFAGSSAGVIRIGQDGSILFWPSAADSAARGSASGKSGIREGRLPVGLASPAVAAFSGGFIVLGGNVGGKASDRAFLVNIALAPGAIASPTELPRMPYAVAMPGAAVMGGRLFVGAADGSIFSTDLAATSPAAGSTGWTRLPRLPVSQTCTKLWLAAQYDGQIESLHAICLRAGGASAKLQLWRWIEGGGDTLGHWSEKAGLALNTREMADSILSAAAQGQSNLLVFQTGSHACPTVQCPTRGTVWIYNTVIDRWRSLPVQLPGIAPALLPIADGRIQAITSDPHGYSLSQFAFRETAKRFGWLDMSMIALYLVAMVAVGWWFKARNTSTEEFFRGGQSIPWWAAALSIHAALLSSLTYLGLPALVYRTNWIMFISMIILILITPVIVYWIMPFFRRIDATSAYEYLSLRFSMPIRRMASGLFAVFHIGRMAIVLSLSGLALASVTPLAPWQSVLLMGVLSLTYSTMGGVEAVVWTEALQTLVLSSGALLCFFFLLHGIDGGFASYLSMGVSDGKFTMIDWNFSQGSWLTFSIWVVVLGGIGQNLSTYGADQAVIQRYLVTKTEKKAAASIWLNAITTAPSGIIFFLIGTGLFYFYRAHPEKLDPSIQIDQIFPTFIANEVPTGVAGLIIAGVFAATQSAVATSVHSISTTMVVDFLRPSGLNWSDEKQLRAARLFTILIGALGTGIGLVFINPAIRSLFEAYMAVIGMSMGALGGLFLTGMTTRRVGSVSAFLGLCSSVSIMLVLWRTSAINPYLFSAVGVFSCYILAWLFSFITGPSSADLTNLTVMTMTSNKAAKE